MSNKLIQQIYAYIQANGNFLSSQKVLKEVQKHPDIVWELIVKLCSKLKNRNIQNAYAQIIYVLADPDKHVNSAKWLKEYMDIKDLSTKLQSTYTVLDYIKPEKEKIINLIHKIVNVSKGVNKLKDDLDPFIAKDELLLKQMNKQRLLEESMRNQLQQLKQKIQKEKPLHDQTLFLCNKINEQIITKREEKNKHNSKKWSIKDETSQRERLLKDIQYQKENKKLNIQQLKKEIALNAPQVKKQKKSIEQEYVKVEKQVWGDIQQSRNRQKRIYESILGRNQYRTDLVQLANQLIDDFNILNDRRLKSAKSREQNDSIKRRKKQLQTYNIELKDKIQQHISLGSQQSTSQTNALRQKQRLDINQRSNMAKVTEVREQTRIIKEKLKKFKEIHQFLAQSIQKQLAIHEEKCKQLQDKKNKWDERVLTSLQQVYTPIAQLQH